MFLKTVCGILAAGLVFMGGLPCTPMVGPPFLWAGEGEPPPVSHDEGANPGILDRLLPLGGEGDDLPTAGSGTGAARVDERLSGLLERLNDHASAFLGDWVHAPAVWNITWMELLLSGCLLLLLVMGERLLRAIMTRLLRKEEEQESPRAWIEVFLRGTGKPFSLLVLVYGVYAALLPLLGEFQREDGSNHVHAAARALADVGGAVALFWFGLRVLRLADRSFFQWGLSQEGVVKNLAVSVFQSHRGSLKLLMLLALSRVVLSFIHVPDSLVPMLKDFFAVAFIAALTWLLIESARVMEMFLLGLYRLDVTDNRQARRVHTQLRFLRRFVSILVLVLGVASALMLFEKVRQLGTSLLASAGVMGIVVGLAAQRSIANLLVGLQIAVTQPITLDDVVIIEGEWGRVEEITSTYVVVRIWDLRRLIVPLSYFTEKPFQNWTRNSSEILGTVFIHVDYAVDVDEVRRELYRLLQEAPWWDGKVWGLAVTDSKERTMELRCLMSAANSSDAWDLRCHIREKLIAYLQKNYPSSLPRIRVELGGPQGREVPAEGCREPVRPVDDARAVQAVSGNEAAD